MDGLCDVVGLFFDCIDDGLLVGEFIFMFIFLLFEMLLMLMMREVFWCNWLNGCFVDLVVDG